MFHHLPGESSQSSCCACTSCACAVNSAEFGCTRCLHSHSDGNINDKRQTTLDRQWSLTSPQQYADLYQLRKESKIFFFQLLEGGGEMFNQTWKIPLDDSSKSNQMIVFMSKVFMWYLSICIKRLLAL